MDWYQHAREFALQHIEPYAKEIDEQGRFPVESFKAMGDAGFFELLVPAEYGGKGLTAEEHMQVVMAFAQSCPSAGLCYMMHNVALNTVATYGGDELKKEIFASVVEKKKFLALAYSEFGTGTHFYIPQVKVDHGSDGIRVTGSKSMVTSAEQASYYLILAESEDKQGVNNWIVPLESQGLSFEQTAWKGVGMRGNISCPMHMDHMFLPAKYRIGADKSGVEQVFNAVAPLFIVGLASVYTGVCKSLCELSTNYSIAREYPDSKKLCSIETVQLHLSNLYTNAAAAEFLTREAARAAKAGEPDAILKIIAARINASELAISGAALAMRVGGGKAYNKAISTERFMRDSYAGQIMAPSVDVLHLWLGKAMTGQPLL